MTSRKGNNIQLLLLETRPDARLASVDERRLVVFHLDGGLVDVQLAADEHLGATANALELVGTGDGVRIDRQVHGHHIAAVGERPDVQRVHVHHLVDVVHQHLANVVVLEVARKALHEDVHDVADDRHGGGEHQQAEDERANRIGQL